MRLVVLLDTKIDKDEALALLDEYADFYKDEFDIDTTFWVERRDFTTVPTEPDRDGDLKPTDAYRKSLETDVHKRYGDYGTDRIIMWVHQDNFLYRGIWGSAWAYNFYKYSFELCRWDKRNSVNTINTLSHEGYHPIDTLIKRELGIDINPIIKKWIEENGTADDKAYVAKNGFLWDRDFVHGGLPSAPYVGGRGYTRSKENLQIINVIAPLVKQAYQSRKEKHLEPLKAVQRQIIAFLQGLLNRK